MTRNSSESLTPEASFSVLEEQLDVQVRKNVTGIVRLEKTIRTHDALVDLELMRDTLSVERIPVNERIDEPAVTRYEGDIMIVPVMEEVVIVSRQLILKEEIRITRRQELVRYEQTVPLRAEEIDIERIEPPVTT